MIIFDVGANHGFFTDKCLETYPNSKIILIEPNPNLCIFLHEKYINNSNISIEEKIAHHKSGEKINFFIGNVDTISTNNLNWITKSRFSKISDWESPIKIDTITLDDLIKKYGKPNLIKIDVEGSEFDVIKGLTYKVDELCFEWTEENFEDVENIINYLENLGYKNFGFLNGDEHLVRPNKYTLWKDSEIHKIVNKNSQVNWGLIWVK